MAQDDGNPPLRDDATTTTPPPPTSIPPHLLQLPSASPADIVRSHQKDSAHVSELRSLFSSAAEAAGGSQLLLRASPEVHLLSDLVFYGLTIGLGKQTLGEEYSDLLSSILLDHASAPRIKRFALVLCLALVPWFSARAETLVSRRRLQILEPAARLFSKLHLAAFYFLGDFVDPVRRLFSSRLFFSREPTAPRPSYRVLGVFIVLQLAVEAGSLLSRALKGLFADKLGQPNQRVLVPSLSTETEGPSWMGNCGICLSAMTSPACPPCGHCYCYACIVEASISKSECPTCRQRCLPQDVLVLA